MKNFFRNFFSSICLFKKHLDKDVALSLPLIYHLIQAIKDAINSNEGILLSQIIDQVVGKDASLLKDKIIAALDDILRKLNPTLVCAAMNTLDERYACYFKYIAEQTPHNRPFRFLELAASLLMELFPDMNHTKAITTVENQFIELNPTSIGLTQEDADQIAQSAT